MCQGQILSDVQSNWCWGHAVKKLQSSIPHRQIKVEKNDFAPPSINNVFKGHEGFFSVGID